MQSFKEVADQSKYQKPVHIASAVLKSGAIAEMVYQPAESKTAFIVLENGQWRSEPAIPGDDASRLVPFSPGNNLIKNDVVLFPSEPAEYDSVQALVSEIQAFIHRYVDVSSFFEKIASYYVLLSWVYDGFNELPYLRVRGDPGCGKTRFLLTVGSICYKPIFASGASTVSPIFRMIDLFRGTLIIDESDFRMSDEKAEIVKILNNGNVQGFPVLRSEALKSGEYNPCAYQVFGPKIVATRGYFDDRALESRFLTEEMGHTRLRNDVPINLPPIYKQEALHLRNKLLLFRFKNLRRRLPSEELVDRTIEPRLNQIFVPLLSIVEDEAIRQELRDLARQYQQDMVAVRGMDTEAQVLEIIKSLRAQPETTTLSIADITNRFDELHGDEYERKIAPRWIGSIVAKRLGLKTRRTREGYIISEVEIQKLERLYERYGLTDDTETAESAPAAA